MPRRPSTSTLLKTAAVVAALTTLPSCSKKAPLDTTAPEAGTTTTTHRSTSPPMTFTLAPAPYSGPTDLYDGFEPDKYTAMVLKTRTAPWHSFSFEDLTHHELKGLAAVIGEEAFRRIVNERKLRQAMPGGPWVAASGLTLSFVLAPPLTPSTPGAPATTHELAIVGFGEWQPARYVVQLESLWRLTPAR